MSKRTALAAALCLLACSPSARAQALVIHDGKPTLPIAPYMAGFFASEPTVSPAQRASPPMPLRFPIKSTRMAPGVMPAALNVKVPPFLATAVFVVGDDDQSRQWLARHRDSLAKMGATGIVVNAASFGSFRTVQAAGADLPMAPGSMDSLAQQIGLRTYPFVLTPQGVVTQDPSK